MLRDLPQVEREIALYERCRVDRLAFFSVYLGDVFGLPYNRLHRDIAAIPKTPWTERKRQRHRLIVAPRGSAKSTQVSYGELVHDAVYGFEAFVPIASTTHPLAEDLVKDLYGLFTDREENALLHDTFGPFRVKGTQTHFQVTCPGNPHRFGTTFGAYSLNGRCRGITARGRVRPTKWVMDDIVDPQTVRNPQRRDDDERFIDDDIGKSGWSYTEFWMVGTRVHPDDSVSRKVHDPMWASVLYRAIEAWPEEKDGLWAQARDRWRVLDGRSPEQREAEARAFYEAHREAMDAGARVLWPEHPDEGLFPLMVQWWANPSGFYREKQNDPGLAADQVFRPDEFQRCVWDPRNRQIRPARGDRLVRLEDCNVAVWWDPIRYGSNARVRDEAAFAVVARERSTSRRFVIELHYVEGPTSVQRRKLFDLYGRFGQKGTTYHYENNIGALHLEEAFRKAKPAGLVLREHNSQQAKNDRIVRIEPDCANGFIEFATSLPPQLFEEYRQFPGATHDDGMDAVERADWVLGEPNVVTFGGWPDSRVVEVT